MSGCVWGGGWYLDNIASGGSQEPALAIGEVASTRGQHQCMQRLVRAQVEHAQLPVQPRCCHVPVGKRQGVTASPVQQPGPDGPGPAKV